MHTQLSEKNITWTYEAAAALFACPFSDLLHQAQTVHRQHFDPNAVQISSLLSIKTGACPEDCGYCSQSAHHNTGLSREKLMDPAKVLAAAKQAQANGADRFCMGTAWRSPPRDKEFVQVLEMIQQVKALGLETCATLGMLTAEQAIRLKEAGLDYYNHNLDTSPEYYPKVTSTRTYQDRLDTLENVRKAEINVCCGGIIGMGEKPEDRIQLLLQLANLPTPPQSVPINKLVPIQGTPLGNSQEIDDIDFVRTIAAARIMMPRSFVRLSAGRNTMSPATQALCFLAGANSIFYGEALLTTSNPSTNEDQKLWKRLGIKPLELSTCKTEEKADCEQNQ